MPKLSGLVYDAMYRYTKPDWDTGVTLPEIVELVKNGGVKGRALELGCGTGTNSVYLAQQGLDVVAVDFSPKAIELAREKAKQAGVSVDFRVGDVTRLDFLRDLFDFALDVVCFHGLADDDRTRYAQHLARLTHPGSRFLMLSFERPQFFGRYGVTPEAAQAIFAPHFEMTGIQHSLLRGKRPVAWYQFLRQ